MEKRVYLAGPVRGLDYKEAVEWREYVKNRLAEFGIVGVSPMRDKEHLYGKLIEEPDDDVISCQRGLTVRDRFDVMTCNVFFSNLLNAKRVSIGTMIEYGWADAFRKPIITVMENKGNVHEHPILRELTGFRVESLDEGLEVVKSLLCCYRHSS